jgi:2-methylaconitate cis-trans-isomerase PrpF
MGILHKAYPVPVAIGTSAAAMIEGTIFHERLSKSKRIAEDIRLGHPGRAIRVGTSLEKRGDTYVNTEALLFRTARRLMDGYVYVPQKCFSKLRGTSN